MGEFVPEVGESIGVERRPAELSKKVEAIFGGCACNEVHRLRQDVSVPLQSL